MPWTGPTLQYPTSIKVTPLSIAAANQYLEKIGFVEFINNSVTWDPKHCHISPGNLAKSVVLSTFASTRTPLYHISRNFEGTDTESLFEPGCQPQDLSDDAIARTLDKISEAGPEALYTRLSLSCLATFDIPVHRLHADTTSLSLSGAYEECEADDYDGLAICRGYSKDMRPDLKQVMVGKIVSEQGIPLVSLPLDGNTADSSFNQLAAQLLADTFGERMRQMVYIADSKLINLPTLSIFNKQPTPIQIISRCPDSFHHKLAVKVKERAYRQNDWVDQGQFGEGNRRAAYQTQSFTEMIDGHLYRLIVVKTSAGRDRVNKMLEKEAQELKKELADLTRQTFACEPDAHKAVAQFLQKHKHAYHQLRLTVAAREEAKRSRGNPGKNPKPPVIVTTWTVEGVIGDLNEDKVTILRQKDECFVLITNVAASAMSDREILREYKEQHVVEVQFRLLKQPAVAAKIFLKKPERIRALLMLLAVALLIRALMQFKARDNLKKYPEAPKIGPNNTRLKNPTADFMLTMFKLFQIVREGNRIWCPCTSQRALYEVSAWLDLLELSF